VDGRRSREVELANYPVGEDGSGNTDSRGVSGARSRQLNNQGAPHASSCGTKLRDWLAFLFSGVGVILSVLVPVAVILRKIVRGHPRGE
jgi:hypothetical protein